MIRRKSPLPKKEKKKKEVGCCYDCIHAYLMQSQTYNPVVSMCEFDKDREVAKVYMCQKNMFERISGDTREIHPMIPCR